MLHHKSLLRQGEVNRSWSYCLIVLLQHAYTLFFKANTKINIEFYSLPSNTNALNMIVQDVYLYLKTLQYFSSKTPFLFTPVRDFLLLNTSSCSDNWGSQPISQLLKHSSDWTDKNGNFDPFTTRNLVIIKQSHHKRSNLTSKVTLKKKFCQNLRS